MKVSYTVPCCKSSLPDLRNKIDIQLREHIVNPSLRKQIVLAIDEACSNAIIHGHDCDNKKAIDLEIQLSQQQFEVKIFDIGCYQPSSQQKNFRDISRNIQEAQKGGLGVKLMHCIMDKVQYYRQGDRHIVHLVKNIAAPQNRWF